MCDHRCYKDPTPTEAYFDPAAAGLSQTIFTASRPYSRRRSELSSLCVFAPLREFFLYLGFASVGRELRPVNNRDRFELG
jgi:hypothetical protein